MDTIGARLRYARDAADCSATALAALAGLSPAHVGMIERGDRFRLAYPTVSRLARVLGVSTDWLADGIGPTPDPAAVRASVEAARTAAAPQVAA